MNKHYHGRKKVSVWFTFLASSAMKCWYSCWYFSFKTPLSSSAMLNTFLRLYRLHEMDYFFEGNSAHGLFSSKIPLPIHVHCESCTLWHTVKQMFIHWIFFWVQIYAGHTIILHHPTNVVPFPVGFYLFVNCFIYGGCFGIFWVCRKFLHKQPNKTSQDTDSVH